MSAATVGIVDYGMGNRRSVEKALERVGARPMLTGDHDALRGRRRRWSCPASARSRRRWRGCATPASTS